MKLSSKTIAPLWVASAAMAGLDQGETENNPGLQDGDEWIRFEAADASA
jgi:hypothetical protein